MIWKTVGAESREDLLKNWEQYRDLALECSPLTHLSKDDPPVYMTYSNDRPVPVEKDGIHHAEFGRIFKEAADPLRVECVLKIEDRETRQNGLETFMLQTFRASKIK
jgi:hypothetical protein